MTTLPCWKVHFTVQEVLDLAEECEELREFIRRFLDQAEARIRS